MKDPLFRHLHFQIANNIDDPNLDISKLLKLTALSRTSLHRVLCRTVGMSATAYVRYIRLQRAAKLLIDNPEYNISEIAYQVGFSSPNYFSRKFSECFGLTPSEWRKKYQLENN